MQIRATNGWSKKFKSNKNGFRDGISEITGGFLSIKEYKFSNNNIKKQL